LDSQGYEVFGFADDIVIMFRGKVESILPKRIRTGLINVANWFEEANLRIEPAKTLVTPSMKRPKHRLKTSMMRGIGSEFSMETKYLGVVLDD
jgi:hypothetical protein